MKADSDPDTLEGRSEGERRVYLKKALASALADRFRHFHAKGRHPRLERAISFTGCNRSSRAINESCNVVGIATVLSGRSR